MQIEYLVEGLAFGFFDSAETIPLLWVNQRRNLTHQEFSYLCARKRIDLDASVGISLSFRRTRRQLELLDLPRQDGDALEVHSVGDVVQVEVVADSHIAVSAGLIKIAEIEASLNASAASHVAVRLANPRLRHFSPQVAQTLASTTAAGRMILTLPAKSCSLCGYI
jgi:hypothetical protein